MFFYLRKFILFIMLGFIILHTKPTIADQAFMLDEDLKTTVAVMSFDDEMVANELQLGNKVANALAQAATQAGYYKVIQRSKTAYVLLEALDAVKVGRDLCVDKVIIGRINKYQAIDSPREIIISATAQVIDAASGKIVDSVSIKGSSGQKFDYMGSNQPLINEAINNLSSQMILALKKALYIEGIIISIVSSDKVKLDLDRSRGINIAAELAVVRAGEQFAKIKVEDVKIGYSVARIISLEAGQEIKVNDKVKLMFNPVISSN